MHEPEWHFARRRAAGANVQHSPSNVEEEGTAPPDVAPLLAAICNRLSADLRCNGGIWKSRLPSAARACRVPFRAAREWGGRAGRPCPPPPPQNLTTKDTKKRQHQENWWCSRSNLRLATTIICAFFVPWCLRGQCLCRQQSSSSP